MTNPYILITGVTGAIGKATAFAFARQMPFHLIIAGRNRNALLQLKEELREINPTIQVDLLVLDIGELDSVAAAIKTITDKYLRLYGIINLAATITRKKTITKDGLETMYSTNYLGPFYLTTSLCEHYGSRHHVFKVITASSASFSTPAFANLNGEKKFSSIMNFSQSKACNVLFVKKLARQLEGTNAISIGYDPGIVKSKAMDQMPKLYRWIGKIVGKSPEEASQSLTRLMVAAERSSNGAFFNKKLKRIKVNPLADHVATQDRLWDLSVDRIRKHQESLTPTS